MSKQRIIIHESFLFAVDLFILDKGRENIYLAHQNTLKVDISQCMFPFLKI